MCIKYVPGSGDTPVSNSVMTPDILQLWFNRRYRQAKIPLLHRAGSLRERGHAGESCTYLTQTSKLRPKIRWRSPCTKEWGECCIHKGHGRYTSTEEKEQCAFWNWKKFIMVGSQVWGGKRLYTWFSTRESLVPTGHLSMSGDIAEHGGRLLASRWCRPGMMLNILWCTKQSRTTKNYMAPMSTVPRLGSPVTDKPVHIN